MSRESKNSPSARPPIDLREDGDDVLLSLRVQPRASRTAHRIEPDGTLRVSVTAPPADGAANRAVCDYLAACLNVSKRSVAIAHGAASRNKTVRISGVSLHAVRDALIPAAS